MVRRQDPSRGWFTRCIFCKSSLARCALAEILLFRQVLVPLPVLVLVVEVGVDNAALLSAMAWSPRSVRVLADLCPGCRLDVVVEGPERLLLGRFFFFSVLVVQLLSMLLILPVLARVELLVFHFSSALLRIR